MIQLSEETEALAKKFAEMHGVTVDEVFRRLLKYDWADHVIDPMVFPRKDMSPEAIAKRKLSVDKIIAEIKKLPILDPRTPQEIMDDINEL